MNVSNIDKLHEVLSRQYAAHEELLRNMQAQQQAIRRFDTAELQTLREHCERVAERIADLERTRAGLTGQGVKLTELAGQLPEPHQSRLLAMAAGLRKLAEEIASVSRVNGTAVQNMLNHFQDVYQRLAGVNRTGAYQASGRSADAVRPMLVDAVA